MKHKELLEKIQNALRGEKNVSAAEPPAHSYVRATALRVPSTVPIQNTTAIAKSRKTDVVTKEWNNEVKQTSNCSSHMESESTPGASLIPARVNRWKIKNYSSIARKMQMLVKPKEGDLTEKVSVITSSQEDQTAHENKKQDQLWRDMMKTNEERQFRIGRIINYFS